MSWFSRKVKRSQAYASTLVSVPQEVSPHVNVPSSGLPEANSQVERLSNQANSASSSRYGLVRLEPSGLEAPEGSCCLDIVAIHGLNGDARRSWTKGDGPLWLQENLPRSLPGARVYTYSYNSKVWSSSRGDVRDWAKTLLVCLSSQRKTEKHRGRGIVFICHSLGGIVCKRALIEANEDHSFSNILESTKAIIFFGTPHVGSEQADFASMLALIAESLGTATLADRISGQRIRRDLVELLRNQSKALEDISMSFRNRLQGIEIVSFYEQDTIRGMRQLIVPRNSALMNCTGEHQIPSPGKDHSTMCQLDQYDNEYNVIIDMCEKHQSAIMTEPDLNHHVDRTHCAHQERPIYDEDLEKERKCLNALRLVEVEMIDRRAHLATPAPGTCEWVLSYPRFKDWISSGRSDVLHLTGDMGSGKTTMMSFLSHHIRSYHTADHVKSVSRPFTVCSFFCSDQHHRFRDAVWILRGLLFQLLENNLNLQKSMHTSITSLGDIPAENWNQSLLWPRLKAGLNSPLTGPVVLIIDALDECQQGSISLLLENIGSLLEQTLQGQSKCIKVLISSRPNVRFKSAILPFVTTLSVDAIDIFEHLQQDVQILINSELDRLALAGRWKREMKSTLETELLGKAGVSFLWVRLVLNRMELGSQDIIRLRKVISESPKDLDQLYCHILAGIEDDNRDLAARMLRILVGSMRPLTTNEFRMALAIVSSEKQSLLLEDIENARDCNIKQSIRNVLRSLAYVRGNKVQLYHISTKDFLLRLASGKVNNMESFPSSIRSFYGVTLHAANLDLARACITFLGLDDFNEDADKSQDETLSLFAELPADIDDNDQLEDVPADARADPPLASSSSDDDVSTARVLSVAEKIKKHLFYAYSASHWATHLRSLGNFATKELLKTSIHISDPSEHCLMHWSDLYRTSSQEWVALPKPLDPLIISAFFGVVSLGNEVFEQSIYVAEESKSIALCWACRMGHLGIVELLLTHKTSLMSHELEGRWPISWACANGHKKIVELLLKEDRDSQINLVDHKNRSPFSLAVELGDLDITSLLIDTEGVDLNMADRDGWTPIHWSSSSKMGHDDMKQLRKLLSIKAIDLSIRDKRGRTILSWAAEQGALKAIKVLLKSHRPELGSLLEDTGDVVYGRSPLSYAAFYGHYEVVKALCETGKADSQVASVDNLGQNAVLLAADRSNWEVIQVIAQYYPKSLYTAEPDGNTLWPLDFPERDGRTPLSAAMWAGNSERSIKTVRILIQCGVDVDKRNNRGRTPLSFAEHVCMIRILVEEGNADMDVADKDGMLPEDHHARSGNVKAINEIRRLRAGRTAEIV